MQNRHPHTQTDRNKETPRPQDTGQIDTEAETGQIHQRMVLLLVGNHKLMLRFINYNSQFANSYQDQKCRTL